MKNYFKFLFKHKILLIVVLVSSFLLGFTILSLVNTYGGNYSVTFTCESDSTISFDEMLTKEYLQKTKDSLNKNGYYDDIDPSKLATDVKVSFLSENTYKLVTSSQYYPDFFLKSSESVSTRAKGYLKALLTNYASDNNYTLSFFNENIIEKYTPISTGWVYGISTISLVLFTGIYVFFEYRNYKKHIDEEEIPYDNVNIYQTMLHKGYWKDVFSIFKDVRKITLMAMMLALMILCKFISLPSGFGNLGLSFTYIVFSLASMILGPFAGLILGTLSDIIGYFIFQSSSTFFIGYTLQAALTGFIYGAVFYKAKFSYARCFIARALVSIVMNVIVGSLCWGFLANYNMEQIFFYAVIFELPKNLVYLVPQSLVLYIIIKGLCPILYSLRLIKKEQFRYYKMKEEPKIEEAK